MALVTAVYCRISSDREGTRLGVERQQSACLKLCEVNDLNEVDIYVDNDRTAADPDKPRPEYLRMMRDIAAGKIDTVVVYREDRLHRQPLELEHFVAECKAAGMSHLLSVKSGPTNLSDPAALMTLRIKGDVAAYEVEVTRDRILDKKRANALAGKSNGGGTRAFGYGRNRLLGFQQGVIDSSSDQLGLPA